MHNTLIPGIDQACARCESIAGTPSEREIASDFDHVIYIALFWPAGAESSKRRTGRILLAV